MIGLQVHTEPHENALTLRIMDSIMTLEETIDGMTEEKSLISGLQFLPFDDRDKLKDYYDFRITDAKQQLRDMTKRLEELGYEL